MYIHKSARPYLSERHSQSLNNALRLLNNFRRWNVVKFNVKDGTRLSFLEYENFDCTEFPCLMRSCQVDLTSQTTKNRNHSTENPPVLHRKELLMYPGYPGLAKFQQLTAQLENMGAFKNIVKLGTKLRWQDELYRLNIVIKDHTATNSSCQDHVS